MMSRDLMEMVLAGRRGRLPIWRGPMPNCSKRYRIKKEIDHFIV